MPGRKEVFRAEPEVKPDLGRSPLVPRKRS